jgi:hypothetical protein
MFGLFGAGLFFFWVIGSLLYFLPTIVGFVRKRHNVLSIFLVNFFLGWSLIGWIVAMAWALSSSMPGQQQIIIQNNQVVDANSGSKSSTQSTPQQDKLAHLHQLKSLFDSGALTQEEFDAQKAKALGA